MILRPLCILCVLSRLRVLILCAFSLITILAAASVPSFTDVFTSGTDGYHTYRIPAIVVTANGTVLAFCEGRKNSRNDTGKIDLLLKRSTDGGKTWSKQQIIRSDGDNVCGNPAPVVDQMTGVVWLLMTWNLGTDGEREINNGTSKDTRRVFVTHSTDDGVTWTKPQEITASVKKPDWRWYATGPVNGIQLTRGAHKDRLVIPCNHTELNSTGQPVSRAHVIYSDDHGKMWQLAGIEDELTNESTVVERADGSLLHNMRSYHKKNRRAVAISNDGGETYDEGATWPVSQVIHSGPSAYSCLAVLPDKLIMCLFECGEKGAYERISLARMPLDWLEKDAKAK